MVSKNLPLAFITAALALMIPRVEKEVSPIMARVQPGTFKQSNSTTQNSSSSSVNDDLRRAGIGIAGTIAGAIVVALSGWLCKQAYRKLRNNQGKRSAGSNGTGLSGGPNGGAPADLVRNETGMQPTTSPLGTLPTGQELRTNARHTGLPSDVPQLPPLAFGDAHRILPGDSLLAGEYESPLDYPGYQASSHDRAGGMSKTPSSREPEPPFEASPLPSAGFSIDSNA